MQSMKFLLFNITVLPQHMLYINEYIVYISVPSYRKHQGLR